MYLRLRASFVVVLVASASACAPSPGTGTGDAGLTGDAGSVEQLPPEGDAELRPWLAEEHYLDWTCQPSVGPGADGSHGPRRICHNHLLATALSGEPLPVGSAVVKEIYDENDARTGTAVMRKVSAAEGGAAWYFYERLGDFITADGRDQVACTFCHAGAADQGGREMVFVDVE